MWFFMYILFATTEPSSNNKQKNTSSPALQMMVNVLVLGFLSSTDKKKKYTPM